jgi:predicted RNA-binding Zn-ribbon protein involved in translation (DUF1610 family)
VTTNTKDDTNENKLAGAYRLLGYTLPASCTNCSWYTNGLTIPKGTKIHDKPCPHCGNKTLITGATL